MRGTALRIRRPAPVSVTVRRRATPTRATLAEAVALRTASASDADAIHTLISEHLAEGRLLPRERDEIAAHAHRFLVAVRGADVVACGELARLSHAVAEVRSLVVRGDARSRGVGRRLVEEMGRRAAAAGFERLAAFSHAPAFFVRMGFSLVPHAWLPEKIAADCHSCPVFRGCGQYAVVRPLARPRHNCVPLTSLHV